MQQKKKLKPMLFFFNVIHTLKRNCFLRQGITGFKIQKQVPFNLDEKSSQCDTVTNNVMNEMLECI